MITLTRSQRIALKKVYDRRPLFLAGYYGLDTARQSYRQFRKLVSPGPGCIMIPWCGMYLGIEPDGYTHS